MKSIVQRGIASRAGAGRRPIATQTTTRAQPQPIVYPAGSYTFTTPYSGYWKFVLWGAGGGGGGIGGTTGGSGAYVEVTRYLQAGQNVALSVNTTTATFPGGSVITAGAASGATAGVASGGDVNLNGSAGTAAGGIPGTAGAGSGGGAGGGAVGSGSGGAGAPAMLPFRGGTGGAGNATYSAPGYTPGGGSGESNTRGGDGVAIVLFVRD